MNQEKNNTKNKQRKNQNQRSFVLIFSTIIVLILTLTLSFLFINSLLKNTILKSINLTNKQETTREFQENRILKTVLAAEETVNNNNQNNSTQIKQITECTTITEPGEYIIVQDLKTNEREKICLRINSSNVKIDGNFHKIYGYNEYGSKAIFIIGNKTNILSNIEITRINIQDGSEAINIGYSTDLTLSYITVNNMHTGITINESSRIKIIGNNIKTIQRGIQVYNSQILTIEDTTLNSQDSNSISFSGSYYIDIIKNTIENSPAGSINVESLRNVNIKENTIKNGSFGILANRSSSMEIEGNIIENMTYQTISIQNGENVIIKNNTLKNTETNIYLNNIKNTEIKNNDFSNSKFVTLITNSENMILEENDLKNITQSLIKIENSTQIKTLINRDPKINNTENYVFYSNATIIASEDFLYNNPFYEEESTIKYIIPNYQNNKSAQNESTQNHQNENQTNLSKTLESNSYNLEFNSYKDLKEYLEVERITIFEDNDTKESFNIFDYLTLRNIIIITISIIIILILISELKPQKPKKRGRKKKRFKRIRKIIKKLKKPKNKN